jgi:hypothetical protein
VSPFQNVQLYLFERLALEKLMDPPALFDYAAAMRSHQDASRLLAMHEANPALASNKPLMLALNQDLTASFFNLVKHHQQLIGPHVPVASFANNTLVGGVDRGSGQIWGDGIVIGPSHAVPGHYVVEHEASRALMHHHGNFLFPRP